YIKWIDMGEGDRWRKYALLQQIAKGEVPLETYSPQDLMKVAEGAILARHIFEKKSRIEGEVRRQELRMIRMAIYLCLSTGREAHAAALVEGIVKSRGICDRENDERVATAIGALSAFSSGSAAKDKGTAGIAKKKLIELLEDPDPAVQVAVIKNLTNADDLEIFERVALLLKAKNSKVRNAALGYMEQILCEVAFRGKEGEKLAPEVILFLKKTLVLLEKIQVDVMLEADSATIKRLNLMIALTYNHILRDMYKEAEMGEGMEMRPYMAVLEHFTRSAPAFVGLLAKRLFKTPAEAGMDPPLDANIKMCVIDAMERMGYNEKTRGRIIKTLKDFCLRPDLPEALRGKAMEATENLEQKNFRHSIPPRPRREAKTSIVPGPRTLKK
ncbi:MAG: hypothetical protein QXH30_03145, partial [Candidatus Bilamarchaeaceae archaeon]